jgi:hypothetical protein
MGIKEGYGEIYYKTGEIFKGNFNNDKANLRGNMLYSNGDTYDGMFKDGLKHGQGKYIYKCDNNQVSIYEGNFINDVKHG